jgi:hypothetical protein
LGPSTPWIHCGGEVHLFAVSRGFAVKMFLLWLVSTHTWRKMDIRWAKVIYIADGFVASAHKKTGESNTEAEERKCIFVCICNV